MDMEIVEEFSASNDHVHLHAIVKKKRSKRVRNSSSASSNCTFASSSTCTDEDQDMANCLILLARGHPAFDCNTCGRSFPSFQALGGHRASHKKPRVRLLPPPPSDHHKKRKLIGKLDTVNRPPPPRSLESKSKVHECSLCGSAFASGQALGGHMRRHRPVAATAKNEHRSPPEKTVMALDLDLNLPAKEDDRLDAESDQHSTNLQQPRIVFSAAELVDCHY